MLLPNRTQFKQAARSLLLRGVARAVAPPRGEQRGAPRRILLIRPDHLGDVLFLTPALRALREAQPEARITVLVGSWAASLLQNNPDVDAVETLRFPWFDRAPKARAAAPYQRLYEAARQLRGRFDVAVVCRFDHWWGAWLAAAVGIPHRVGYATRDVAPFLTEPVPYIPGQHEVVQNFALLRALGTPASATPPRYPLRFPVSDEARAAARSVLAERGLGGDTPLVALHPGSGALVKRWQVERWAALMATLHESHGARFVITGGPDEVGLAAQVAGAAPSVPVRSVAGQTSLPVLAALFEQCALVIGPDSGPLHLAVAAGRPTLHLYGPVDPATFGPWGDPTYNVVLTQALACQFCNRLDWRAEQLPDHPCVSGIPVGWVASAATRLLAQND